MKRILIHIYLMLWCLYLLQGTLYPSGGIVSQSLLIVLLLVSIYYFFFAISQYKLPKVLIILSVILGVFTLYGAVSLCRGETFTLTSSGRMGINALEYLKNIFISFLPIYVIYVASTESYLDESTLRFWTVIFLIISIIGFYRFQNELLTTIMEKGLSQEEVTNNGAYEILAVMTLLPLFHKRPILQYALLVICILYVMIGMKRGALICTTAATLWFLYNSLRTRQYSRRSLLILALTIVTIFVIVHYVNFILESSDYFRQRLELTTAGDSSKRNELYGLYWHHFLAESNPLRFLFGNGANATLNIGPNYAHNDWLEIAINNGIVVVILYFIYWLTMFNTILCHMLPYL